MKRPTDKPELDRVFSGDCALPVALAIKTFMEQVNKDATDAAFTLKRKIKEIAEDQDNGKNKKPDSRRCSVLPFSDNSR